MEKQEVAAVQPEGSDPIRQICRLTPVDACTFMGSRPTGLREQEVRAATEKYGKNEIERAKGKSPLRKFIANFVSMMAILLWISGTIAILANMPALGIAVYSVNILNGVFSFWQEFRASKATEALQKMLPSYARVIRDGRELKILATDLVPGDVMLLEEGDKISADARLLVCNDLQLDQSTLTGESNPIRKSWQAEEADMTPLEAPNMIFAGTNVSAGTGKAVVVATGMRSEFGKIANLTQSVKEAPSPLQRELNLSTKRVAAIAISIGAVFMLTAVFLVQQPVLQAFIFALGMVVAFVPEGLLPAVTLSLAMAVQRMAKAHALVKNLPSVETLGCTNVICSDKTGTLTQNEMTVNHLWLPGKELRVSGEGYAPKGQILDGEQPVTAAESRPLHLLLTAAGLCANARLVPPDPKSLNTHYTVLGDPTEACLGVAAQKGGVDIALEAQHNPRIRELPFDSRRKRMCTIHQLSEPLHGCSRIAYIKGAPKEVMELCTHIFFNGRAQEISPAQREEIMQANDRYAREGLRVLGVAYRLLPRGGDLPTAVSAYTPELVEKDMTFVGLVVMQDPPRAEVKDAIQLCHSAGIRVIMITGDYGLTAESIARKIGIIQGDKCRIVSGAELAEMPDEALKEVLRGEVVFARVAPEQKYRVVTNLQEMGNIVAVTGDGVNDAPALKKADIGVAMGITGTDVAKEAADMILTDDNFASIVKAIEQGRAVYHNIRRFMTYMFNSNTAEAAAPVLFLLSGGLIASPLTVMQILTVDVGTDMLPALGLGTEEPEEGVMEKPPRKMDEHLLNKSCVTKGFIWYGLLETAASMLCFFGYLLNNGWPAVPLVEGSLLYRHATTMALAAIVMCQVGMVMNCRTERASLFSVGLLRNKHVLAGIVFELALLCTLIYVPVFWGAFNTAPLSLTDWLALLPLPFLMVAIDETRKYFLRKKHRKDVPAPRGPGGRHAA